MGMKNLLLILNLHFVSIVWSQLRIEELENEDDIIMFLRQNKICEDADSISFSGLDMNYANNYKNHRLMDSSEYLKLKRNIIVDINNDGKLDLISKPLINGYTEAISILSYKGAYSVYKISATPYSLSAFIGIDTTQINTQNVLLYSVPKFSIKTERTSFVTDTLIGINNGLISFSIFKPYLKPSKKIDSFEIKYSDYALIDQLSHLSNFHASSGKLSFSYSFSDLNKYRILEIGNSFSINLDESIKNRILAWVTESNIWSAPDSLMIGGYHYPTIEITLYSQNDKKTIYDYGTYNNWDLRYFYHNWFGFFQELTEEALSASKRIIRSFEY
jgi:hypothetical protein